MDASFIPVEVVPSQTPFALDQLRRSYKTPLPAADALLACPFVGTADETFPNMFLMPIGTPESAESATRVDLNYMGCLRGAEGTPDLPHQKTAYQDSVQTATSSKSMQGITFTPPFSLQYYAPSTVLSYITFGAVGTQEAPVPTSNPRVITFSFGDVTTSPGSVVSEWIAATFTLQIITTFESTEIVPGKYWQNVSRKTKNYAPWIFSITAGAYLSLYNPGNGYTVGDTLSVSAGGESAVVVLSAVGSIWDGSGVLAWTVTSNTFTSAHTALSASGGTGSGAGFNVSVI